MVLMRQMTAGLVAGAVVLAWIAIPSPLTVVSGQQLSPAPSIFIDASVTDASGRAVTNIRPEDLRVTVDGTSRKVISLRYVSRGPGAEAAAALIAKTRNGQTAAERVRLLLLVADENAIPRGQQKPVSAVVTRMLDELGTADQAAVASLPRPPFDLVLSTVAADWQAGLARVTGRAAADAQASAQAPVRPIASAVDATPTGGAQSVSAEDVAKVELDRQLARERLGAQDNTTDSAVDASGGASLRALRDIIDGLSALPGLKSVIVFRQADSAADAPAVDPAANLTSAVLASAARSRVVVHVVTVGQARRKRAAQDDDMVAIALATGGTSVTPRDAADAKAFETLRPALDSGYLLEVEGRPGDDTGRPHAVKVECTRRDATVRAPRQMVARQDPLPGDVAADAVVAPAGDGRTARRSNNDDQQLTLLLARLSEFIAAYVRDFRNVVAEEDYRQQLIRGTDTQVQKRRLRSDLLLVRSNADTGWTQYRDVFEVDGQPVRDRSERVQKLFFENPQMASKLAEQISNESARYNVGSLTRTINTPLLPLAYLMPSRINGLSFRRDGEE